MSGYWTPEPIWDGETVFLVGGGPSLKGFDFERLRGHRCLAINASGYDVPWADVLFFRDHEWFEGNRALIDGWGGRIVTVSPAAKADLPERVNLVEANTVRIPRARTSGHQAVSLAILMKANRIVLLGFDWNYDGGNYHDRHTRQGLKYRGGLLDSWGGYSRRAQRSGAEILNATPGSQIDEFRRVDLDKTSEVSLK